MVAQVDTQKAWARALAAPAREFAPTTLEVLEGHLPTGLRGSLYRNGPGRLERGGLRVGHWFDGDGAILAVHFDGRSARATYRFVGTEGYRAEAQAGRYLYGNYGMLSPGSFWDRWTKPVKNSANTSVLALENRLLALWEGGLPYALDLETLETTGIEDFGWSTPPNPFSAHPKCDPRTGEIFNFGIGAGLNALLKLYVTDSRGRLLRQGRVELDGLPLVHDFALAGPYLVFCIPPVRINPLPIAAGLKSFADAMDWLPKKGTQILIIDRTTLQLVRRFETEPWYQWHFANGHVGRDGALVIDLIRYEDFQTNQYLREVASGETHTPAPASLWRLRVDPLNKSLLGNEQILDRSCEFPTVPPEDVGCESRSVFLAMHRPGAVVGKDYLGALGRFDCETGRLQEADLGEGRYPSEPLFARDGDDPKRGWLTSVIYDGRTDTSEVWIFEADHIEAGPVGRLGLPSVVPHGFHGIWRAEG